MNIKPLDIPQFDAARADLTNILKDKDEIIEENIIGELEDD